jgi:ATP-binding cassette subfamily B protein
MMPGPASRAASPQAEHGEEIFKRFDRGAVRRLLGFILPYRAALFAALVSVILFALVQVSIPIAVRHAVDAAVDTAAVDTAHGRLSLQSALALFAALVAANTVLGFLQEWLASRLAQTVIFDLRRAMFAHLQKVSLSLHDQTHVGRLMSRLAGDVNALQEFMENSVSALGDIVLLSGIVVVLLWMDARLGLLTLAVLPVLILVRVVWLPWARRKFSRAREASSSVNAALAENISGIRTVQENRREGRNFDLYKIRARENLDAQIGSSRASQIMVPAVDILTGAAMGVIVVAGGAAVVGGDLPVGVMVAFIFYVQRFFDPIRTLSMQYTVMQRAMAAAHRIFEVLDLPLTITDKPDAHDLGDIEPSIELRNICFGYAPGQPVLHDLSLYIAPHRTVALVGPTGSGKTSIAALIHRFYDPWQGEVLVGGHDVRDVTHESLGLAIAMVLQEPFLFSGTVEENIRYGVAGATHEEVVAAAKAVRAHDFILQLPQGYDTLLGQRGRNLSIGQRQLLSFARALLVNPKILILDEATANIDSFTELQIQHALKVLFKDRTSIVIAHRLATIREADCIFVLQEGRLVEQGSHDDLLRQQGLYARLHANSHASFDDIDVEGRP